MKIMLVLKLVMLCMKNNILENEEKFNSIFEEIKGLVINSKNKIYTTINTEMLNLYWHIGKIIIAFNERGVNEL